MHDDVELPAYQSGPARGRARRARRVAMLCGVMIAIATTTAAVKWLLDGPDAAASPTSSVTRYGCNVVIYDDPGPDRVCGPPAGVDPRRAPVTDAQRQAVSDTAKTIRRAASHAGWCMSPSDRGCAHTPPYHLPTQDDVDAARVWLAQTGASASTARLARPGDPGFEGDLLYAARVGEVCVIGYLQQLPAGSGGEEIVGILPDGSCLPE